MSCFESFQAYALRSIGFGERLLPRSDFTLCEHCVLIGSGMIWNVYFGVLALGLGFLGLDFVTAVSGAATAISNVGPGLGDIIGPAGNFAPLPDAATSHRKGGAITPATKKESVMTRPSSLLPACLLALLAAPAPASGQALADAYRDAANRLIEAATMSGTSWRICPGAPAITIARASASPVAPIFMASAVAAFTVSV